MAATVSKIEQPAGKPALPWPELHEAAARVWFASSWWSPAAATWARTAPAAGAWGPPIVLSPQGRQRGKYLLAASGGRAVCDTEEGRVYLFCLESGCLFAHKMLEGSASAPPEPPPDIVSKAHARGAQGLSDGLDYVAAFIREDALDELVIGHVRRTIHEAEARGLIQAPRGYPDAPELCMVLFVEQKRRSSFVRDPRAAELMSRTRHILCLDPKRGVCLQGEDCDGQIIALASQLLCAGVRVWLCLRWYAGMPEAHLTMLYDASQIQDGSDLRRFDPSVESGRASDHPYVKEKKMEVSLESPDAIPFVGMGTPPPENASPPGPGDAFAELGATPATIGAAASADLMPQDLAARMFLLLRAERDAIDRAKEQSDRFTEALAQVRASLGYPATDQPPALEGSPGSALEQYETAVGAATDGSAPWTAATVDAQSKLSQTAAFMSGALADALAGRRPTYFHDSDLLIGALPGDVIRIQMVADATGKLVPTYVDPQSGNPLGTIGDIPIALVPLITAFPLYGAAFIVSDALDNLSQAMHLDIGQKLAKATQTVVSAIVPPEDVKRVSDAVVAGARGITNFSHDVAASISGIAIVATLFAGLVVGIVADRAVANWLGKTSALARLAGDAGGTTKKRKSPRAMASEPRYHPGWNSTRVQSLIFTGYSPAKAKAWASRHGFRSGKVDETGGSVRLRQESPTDFRPGTFRTVTLRPGVKAIVGAPRARSREPHRAAEPPHVSGPKWHKLLEGQGYNADVKRAAKGSGAYAIKHAPSGRVLYVGHSHTGRTWKTMLRHLQGADSFERVGDWVYRGSLRDLVVSIWPSSAADAPEIEGELIERLEPAANIDYPAPDEDTSGVPF